MFAQAPDQILAAHDHPGLAGANQLVAAEQDHIRAGGDGLADGRFVRQAKLFQAEQRSRAEVVDQRQSPAVRQLSQLSQRHFTGEADDAVIAGMHTHEGRSLSRDGVLVILEVRAIGRADFDEPGLALGHDFRQPERTADLDQLAARDDDLLLRRQRCEHQHRGGRIIVDDCSRFRAGKLREDILDEFVTLDPLAALAIDGERRVTFQFSQHRIDDTAGENRPSQARMQDDAGRIDRRSQVRARRLREQRRGAGEHGLGRNVLRSAVASGIREQLFAHTGGRTAQAVCHEREWMRLQPPNHLRVFSELRYRRDAFQQILFGFRCHSLPSFNHAFARLSI